MKNRYTLVWSLLFALGLMTLVQSCNEKEGPMKWVDLRYRVEQDSYLIDAKGTETVSFLVKSTDSWEVFGTKRENWYRISPDQGDPGETFTVTITCEENTDLDDRADTINIKSDYWTGKQFLLTQKGIAYLDYEPVTNILQEAGTTVVSVLANQKWTAEVTDGDIWLSIKSGASGELNGTITVQATANSGEQRTGIVTVYDRHGVAVLEVPVTQNGVILDTPVPENGSWFRLYEEAQVLELPVQSNAKWTVAKGNPEDDDWYSFETAEFDGDGVIRVNVNEHVGTSVRTAEIVLSTVADEGATPLVKTIRFKQANPPVVTTTVVNKTVAGGTWWGPSGLKPARYNIYLDSYTGDIKFFWVWNVSPYTELRYHIIGGKTQLSTTPWCNNVHQWVGSTLIPVDGTKQNVLSLNIDKYVDTTGKEPKEWIYVEWILNDVVIAHAISDGKDDNTGADDNFKLPYADIAGGASFQMNGNFTVSKWERVDHLVWGE